MTTTQERNGLAGTPSHLLMANGIPGRGVITEVKQTEVTVGPAWDRSRVLVFTVEVLLDGRTPYVATCRQAIKAPLLPQLLSGVTVPLRVDARDRSKIGLDLAAAPPELTVTSEGSAATVLRDGARCRAVVVESHALGARELHAVTLTVCAEGRSPYWVRLGITVPPEAVGLLRSGNDLPAKRIAGHHVMIDWAAALAEAAA